jgi:hypothetical protein
MLKNYDKGTHNKESVVVVSNSRLERRGNNEAIKK